MLNAGQWVFKNRGWLPLPILALAIFFPEYNPSKINFILGAILILAGEAGRLWAVGYAGGITRTRTGDLNDLVVTGPFAYVRNPIYISNIVMYSGATLILGVPGLLPLTVLYFFIEYSLIILYEESILAKAFSKRYSDYKKMVNRWLPSKKATINKDTESKTKVQSSQNRFSLNEYMVAEKSTFRSMAGIVIIAIAKYYIIGLFG
jgi:protein-S-isoprenylcysteine O-methyltransferase Ste14